MKKKRKYTLRQRAARQEQTRERIVAAAVKLHEELGPAGTTISAIAEEAGVQRLTLYRHFPTEAEIFGACSARYLDLHPPPDMSTIAHEDPAQRARAVLIALYAYYRETERMMAGVYRDLEHVPALAEPIAKFEAYVATVSQHLLAAWAPRRSKRLRATLAHAVAFSTWQSLNSQGLGSKAMAELVGTWITAAAD